MKTIKIIILNLQWAPPTGKRQKIINDIIQNEDPDIICATESYLDAWNHYDHVVSSEEDYGYRIIAGRRKVILISKEAFSDVDNIGNSILPTGRFVRAKTFGVNVFGVCIPWMSAHVSTGRKDKRTWEDHIDYLNGLSELLSKSNEQTLIAGDFNQKIPKHRSSSKKVYEALMNTFKDCNIHTQGTIHPIEMQSIDHLASTQELNIKSITSIDKMYGDIRLSDHFGLIIELQANS